MRNLRPSEVKQLILAQGASRLAQMVKNLPAEAGDMGSVHESERSSGEGNGNPLQSSYLENPHGQRSLASMGSQSQI